MIRTARLLLEPIAEGHAEGMFRVLDDPSLGYVQATIPLSLGHALMDMNGFSSADDDVPGQ